MPKKANQKGRILEVLRFLRRESDEDHPVTIGQIMSHLANAGFSCDRKTVMDDLAVLLEKDGSRKLYFILETKGSTNLDMDVRKRERLKINCGERHFASLANDIEQRSAKTWSEFKEKI